MSKTKKKKIVIHKFHEMDYALVLTSLILSLFGIVMAYSASYYYSISKTGNPNSLMLDNIVYYVVGWAILLIFSRVDYHVWRQAALPAVVIGIILLIALLALRGTQFTKTLNNATRWFRFFGITIMPGELIKPAIILFFAALFSAREDCMKNTKIVIICFAILVIVSVLIYKQPNLSTAIIVFAIGFVMMFIAGLSWWYVGIGGGVAALVFAYLYFIDKGYMHTRVITALDPWADPLGDGYQVIQSLLALGSGGLLGKGLGQSVQKTLYLPEPQSDFILPIIGEELGFIGIVVLLILYVILISRIISISLRSKDRFGAYIAVGTGALIAIHVILNIMVVTATAPPTGVFLPFMSQGGNATWVILGLIGMTLNVSRQAREVTED